MKRRHWYCSITFSFVHSLTTISDLIVVE